MPRTTRASQNNEERIKAGKSVDFSQDNGMQHGAALASRDSTHNTTHSTGSVLDSTAVHTLNQHCDCSCKLDYVLKKLEKLDLLEVLATRVDKVERNIDILNKDMEDMKEGRNFMDEAVGGKANGEEVRELKKQVEDLSNRLRRNNLVFLHIPEGSEDDYESCTSFIKNFLVDHMKISSAADMQMERAHRSPAVPTKGKGIRPIHVAFLRYSDKQMILRAAPKMLKNNPYKNQKVFVSEDFTPEVLKKRREMLHFKRLLQQENPARRVYLSYPARLRMKDGDSWRIFDRDEADSMKYLYQNFGKGRSP